MSVEKPASVDTVISVAFACPACQKPVHNEIRLIQGGSGLVGSSPAASSGQLQTTPSSIPVPKQSLDCDGCRWQQGVSAGAIGEQGLELCALCGCQDLWRQKDFPQSLGIGMVVIGAILSTIAFANYQPLLAIAILGGFALIDMLLYAFMNDVLVCYRCQARYRRFDPAAAFPQFNLETAERYRQTAARLKDSSSRANR